MGLLSLGFPQLIYFHVFQEDGQTRVFSNVFTAKGGNTEEHLNFWTCRVEKYDKKLCALQLVSYRQDLEIFDAVVLNI